MSAHDGNKARNTRPLPLPPIAEGGREWLRQLTECLAPSECSGAAFASPNDVVGELPTMRLRGFGSLRQKDGAPVLIVTPMTLHDSGMADLMRGHSVVEALRASGAGPIYLTDWKSADASMRDRGLDAYVSDLNVAIDDLGGIVDVVGLCQGGWLALVHAARFPGKIRRLVLAGSPIDTGASPSPMTQLADRARATERRGDETVSGRDVFAPLGAGYGAEQAAIFALQRNPASFADTDMRAISAYERWSRRVLDLPARYAQEVATHLFAANSLARGTLTVLGKRLRLKSVKIPIFTLCGEMDEATPKAQTLGALALVGTPRSRVRSLSAPCGHFALFTGARVMRHEWRTIATWLTSQAPLGGRPPARTSLAEDAPALTPSGAAR